MQVVIIVGVDVAAFAATFAYCPKGDLPQTPQLAQQRCIILTIALP